MKEPNVLSINEVVSRIAEFNTIIDARSPSEFAEDHLPGAISAPVLDDEQRAEVGTLNARVGAFEAKRLGAALVSRNIGDILQSQFANQPRDWKPLVYCWRGGNRSGALATVMARIGWRTTVIEGGYKAYRRKVIEELQSMAPNLNLIVVGGRTGSAKSRLLERLAAQGEQVLDLERLACHRGSVLGAWPESAQPSQRRFESLVWDALRQFTGSRPIFVESESRKIGQCQVPGPLIHAIRASNVIIADADRAVRSRFLLDEYHHFRTDVPGLHALLDKLVVMHGTKRVADWKQLIDEDRWLELVDSLLGEHYDPSYDRSMKRNFSRLEQAPVVILRDTDDAALQQAVDALVVLSRQIETTAPRPSDRSAPDGAPLSHVP
jgi:tRNA 2-selenouridine synthase